MKPVGSSIRQSSSSWGPGGGGIEGVSHQHVTWGHPNACCLSLSLLRTKSLLPGCLGAGGGEDQGEKEESSQGQFMKGFVSHA